MYRITTNHSFNCIEDAIKNAVEHGFGIEFIVNERGFFAQQEVTFLPEMVIELEVILFGPKKKSVLYLFKMVNGMCGWTSDLNGVFADEQLSEHLVRIKENFADEL